MSEFFKDMKSLPDPVFDAQDFEDLILEEDRKCTEGIWLITPQGVRYRYSPWLYFHTNHFKIYMDGKHPVTGKDIRVLGFPPLRDTELIYNDALLGAEHYNKAIILLGSRRLGKCLINSELIITPTGEKAIGDIQLGDFVMGKNGKPTKVTGVFPQGEKEIYRLHLLDGRYVDCCLEHNWYVKFKNTHQVLTTEELLEFQDLSEVSIPHCDPVEAVYLSSVEHRMEECLINDSLAEGTTAYKRNFKTVEKAKEYLYLVRSLGVYAELQESSVLVDLEKKETEISRIENLNIKEHATCISVEAEDHLYLTRDFVVTHNTTIEASTIVHSATFYEGSQNVIVGHSKDDIKLITAPASVGLENVWEPLKPWAYKKDWDREVVIGSKSSKGEVEKFSEIVIRNTDEGKNSEVLAGITPSAFVWDEFVKRSGLEVLEGAKPAFTSSNGGWRLIPLLTGTAGSFVNFRDAKNIFEDPDTHDFLACTVPNYVGGKRGLFISGEYRFDCKKQSNLEGFFAQEQDREFFKVEPQYELLDIHGDPLVMIADKEYAKDKIAKKLQEYKDKGKAESYLKYKMYYPMNPDDMWVSKDLSPFSDLAEELTRHRKYLMDEVKPDRVELYKVGSEIHHRFSDKFSIGSFPHKPVDDLDQPIHVMSYPVKEGRYRLEVMGIDPYNVDDSSTSSSLGSVYVMRQLTDDLTDPFRETMVAWYTARPKELKKFYRTVEMLMLWYNASILHENSNAAFFSYFDEKNLGHYFMDTWNLMKEINPKSQVKASKGLAPTPNNQRFIITQIKRYLEEDVQSSSGEIVQGYTRILDPLLIDELLAFNPDTNTDRVWGFGHAVAALYNKSKWMGDSGISVRDDEEGIVHRKNFTSSIYKPIRRSSIYNQLR